MVVVRRTTTDLALRVPRRATPAVGAAQLAAAAFGPQRAWSSLWASPAVRALALTALLAAAAFVAARPGPAPEAAPDTIPPECMDAGLNLQSKCSDEFAYATEALGVDPSDPQAALGALGDARLQQFLDSAPPPSVQCCAASAKFNNAYCSCAPAVLDLILSFTNDDINEYVGLSKYFERRCKEVGQPFTLYLQGTCPKPKK
ncbi:hypothetical protein HYH03_007941 [Edaphochlamys debaryana]|uniref:Uncharacterized protein n=1 Tax=Edaphochlamys debaryana TaxID=47281 RepID=A0A835YAK1_9CHLO|nr:hypothetical protein HYH03_007941 [Edaphochlamys debaryana]|eukprot:KAG2494014.1 hypothetical protein HYH03_007941 [Edaphochlamys debaryana]